MTHDRPTTTIAEYAASISNDDLSDRATASVTAHYLDTIGCGLGGYNQEPSEIARKIARTALTTPGCSVFGIRETVSPEQAVFANGTMIRQLDYNDSYSHIGGGHPSDMMSAIFAAGELVGASGLDLIRGIYVGYEVFAAVAESYGTGAAGWDQGAFIALCAAIGAGSIFGFGFEEYANVVAISLIPAMPLRVTRSGELSNWKGSATPHAAMTGLFAARLVNNGLTGPALPFEGADGFHRQVPQEKELVVGELRDGASAIERTSFKYHPAELHGQAIIEPLAAVRDQFDIADVTKIAIETYYKSWYLIGGGYSDHEEKWHPRTRETADHSLPYVAVVSLLDGDITYESFSDERIADPAIQPLLDVTSVIESPTLTAIWPDDLRTDIAIELRDGRTINVAASAPVGHPTNPMSNDHLGKKFQKLSKTALFADDAEDLEEMLWKLSEHPTLEELARRYRSI